MFYKGKKVVVTGGSGFVGTHYIKELLDRGAIVKTHTHKNHYKYKMIDLKYWKI